MSVSHLLEDFGVYARASTVELSDVLLEEERLEAFEKGYQAGWEDSAKAQQSTSQHVSAEFAQNLKDLSFTYQEAFSGLMKGLRPLIEQIVEMLLPRLGRETLAPRVAELIEETLKAHGRQPVHLVTSPSNLTLLEQLADIHADLPLTVSGESALTEGQVQIRFGDLAEREIDLTGVLRSIRHALSDYFDSDISDHKDIAV